MLGLPPGVEGERVKGQDVVPLMSHVLKIKSVIQSNRRPVFRSRDLYLPDTVPVPRPERAA